MQLHCWLLCWLQGPYVGKTVRSAGFRGMAGIYLVYIDRYKGDGEYEPLHAVSPDTEMHVSGGDRIGLVLKSWLVLRFRSHSTVVNKL